MCCHAAAPLVVSTLVVGRVAATRSTRALRMKLKRAPAACLVRFARRPEVIGYGAGWNTRLDARSAPCGHPPAQPATRRPALPRRRQSEAELAELRVANIRVSAGLGKGRAQAIEPGKGLERPWAFVSARLWCPVAAQVSPKVDSSQGPTWRVKRNAAHVSTKSHGKSNGGHSPAQ